MWITSQFFCYLKSLKREIWAENVPIITTKIIDYNSIIGTPYSNIGTFIGEKKKRSE